MSNPWNAPVSSCGRRGGLGGVTVREADLSAQRRLVYRLLSDGNPRSSADIAAELHLCDPRAIIRDLRNALVRIENKTYGICRVTGKLISKERLMAVPHATLSIEAKKQRL